MTYWNLNASGLLPRELGSLLVYGLIVSLSDTGLQGDREPFTDLLSFVGYPSR